MGSPSTDSNVGYITEFDDVDDVIDLINKLLPGINGNFSRISNNDITTDNYIASIVATTVVFYDDDGQEKVKTVPLQDIYDLAIAWRNFLLEPPLNGTASS
jgi:hypothetical protein